MDFTICNSIYIIFSYKKIKEGENVVGLWFLWCINMSACVLCVSGCPFSMYNIMSQGPILILKSDHFLHTSKPYPVQEAHPVLSSGVVLPTGSYSSFEWAQNSQPVPNSLAPACIFSPMLISLPIHEWHPSTTSNSHQDWLEERGPHLQVPCFFLYLALGWVHISNAGAVA